MAIYSDYSEVASATTESAGGTPVAGAALSVVMDTATVSASAGPAVPPSDGGRICYITDAGYCANAWNSDDGMGGAAGPKYRTSGAHLINSKKTMEVDSGAIGYNGTPLEVNGQQAWSFSMLFRGVTAITGRATMFISSDSPSLELYLDGGSGGANVGFSNDGSDTDVAAGVSGVQVLIYTFDPGAGEVKVYRNTGSGLAQIGVTSANVDGTGYELFNICHLCCTLGTSDRLTGFDVAEFWAHPFVFDNSQLTQHAAYLASQGGL